MIHLVKVIKDDICQMPAQLSLASLKERFYNRAHSLISDRDKESYFNYVLEEIFHIKGVEYQRNKEQIFPESILEQFDFIIHQINQHTPVQYIFNKAYFYKSEWYVNEHVLIPRPETEELVDWVMHDLQAVDEAKRLFEVGVGSGCISVSIAKEFPNHHYLGIDISETALNVARMNARKLLKSAQSIEFKKMDFLNESIHQSFDIIVSNPPYIAFQEHLDMEKNVLDFEPHVALFVPDSNPLVFYARIADFAAQNLNPNGAVYVEINPLFAEETQALFTQKGMQTEIRKDMQGKKRMIKAQKASA
jgi:release factor glutamine methyltransferase